MFDDKFSNKELEVFIHLSEGLTNKEIAEKLFVGKRTVESHLDHIKEKLGLKSIPELRKFARDHRTKAENSNK